MTLNELQRQLQFLKDNGHVTGEEQMIVVGTGNKPCGFLKGGLLMPKISIGLGSLEDKDGFYGLGVSND